VTLALNVVLKKAMQGKTERVFMEEGEKKEETKEMHKSGEKYLREERRNRPKGMMGEVIEVGETVNRWIKPYSTLLAPFSTSPTPNIPPFRISNNISNLIKLWDNFLYLLFEFKLLPYHNQKLLQLIFSHFRNFVIKYISLLQERFSKQPENESSRIEIWRGNLEIMCLRLQQYKDLVSRHLENIQERDSVVEDFNLMPVNSKKCHLSSEVSKICTETFIFATQFSLNTLSKSFLYQSTNLCQSLFINILTHPWTSPKPIETSLSFKFTSPSSTYLWSRLPSCSLFSILPLPVGYPYLPPPSPSIMKKEGCRYMVPSYALYAMRKQLFGIHPKGKVDGRYVRMAEGVRKMGEGIVSAYLAVGLGVRMEEMGRRMAVMVDLRYLAIVLGGYYDMFKGVTAWFKGRQRGWLEREAEEIGRLLAVVRTLEVFYGTMGRWMPNLTIQKNKEKVKMEYKDKNEDILKKTQAFLFGEDVSLLIIKNLGKI
jgi:hypothetical protein